MKLIVTAIVSTILLTSIPLYANTQNLTYGKFIRWVQAGKITSVTCVQNTITGTFTDSDSTSEFSVYVSVEPANDPLLLDLLRKKNIPIEIKEFDPSEYNPYIGFGGLLFIALPVIMLVLLFHINKRVKKLLDYRDPYSKPLKDLS